MITSWAHERFVAQLPACSKAKAATAAEADSSGNDLHALFLQRSTPNEALFSYFRADNKQDDLTVSARPCAGGCPSAQVPSETDAAFLYCAVASCQPSDCCVQGSVWYQLWQSFRIRAGSINMCCVPLLHVSGSHVQACVMPFVSSLLIVCSLLRTAQACAGTGLAT